MSDIEAEHVICLGCGATAIGPQGDPTDVGPSQHCGKCPPWICDDCHETSSMDAMCSCWINVDGLPLADLKAIFALGDMSIGTPITDAEGGEN